MTRSEIWLIHHQEQVDAAREEFMRGWPGWIEKHRKSYKPLFKNDPPKLDERGMQAILWRAFLRKKGLLRK